MCRAFVGIKLGNGAETEDYLRSFMLHYMENAVVKEHNKDGFAFTSHDLQGETQVIRTMDYNEAMQEATGLAYDNVVHGHARKVSRGTKTLDNVHCWEHNGWTCSMNGTIHFKDEYDMPKGIDNDSKHFFQMCFESDVYDEDVKEWAKNIKKVLETTVDWGNGAMFFTNPNYTVVINMNKEVTVHYLGRQIILMNSKDDIHKGFAYDIELVLSEEESKNEVKKGLISFETKTRKQETEVIPAVIPSMEDLKFEFNNKVVVFDNATGDAILFEGVDNPNRHKIGTAYGRGTSTQRRGPNYSAPKAPMTSGQKSGRKGKPGNFTTELDDVTAKYTDFKHRVQELQEEEENLPENANEEEEGDTPLVC